MNIVCFGAHPDDCEIFAGGTMLLWAQAGYQVYLVSVSNGNAGHHTMPREALAKRRRAEAAKAAEIAGPNVHSLVLDNDDGAIMADLDLRQQIIDIICEYKADVVLTHRPFDYHPDHRYTSIAVQDASYLVTVPHCCPDGKALSKMPTFLYMMDCFTRPAPFSPDIGVDVSEVIDIKWAMLDAMESQFYEWLPWQMQRLDSVPESPEARLTWLKTEWRPWLNRAFAIGRDTLEYIYGEEQAAHMVAAELFEVCEYGYQPTRKDLMNLFPFLPRRNGLAELNPCIAKDMMD